MAYSTIPKGSLHMNPVIYTGNGSADRAITGAGFAPNWVWIKKRSSADVHYIFDSVRGADIQLQSNSNAAQYDYSGDANRSLTAFDSDGFTLGTNEGVNHNSQTFVSWNWYLFCKMKAGQFNSSATFNSNVFSVGGEGDTNESSSTIVAYCFSEIKGFSKFGTYVGNGSTDGTFVYTGFKPAFLIVKKTDSVNSWVMFDNKRSSSGGSNEIDYSLTANEAVGYY